MCPGTILSRLREEEEAIGCRHSGHASPGSFGGWRARTQRRMSDRTIRSRSWKRTRPPRAPTLIGRRELLRRGALLGAGAVAATSLGVARAPRAAAARDASVVVVGAGLAGLSCTYRLHRHGIPAILYEAQERLGGRCFSIRDFFDAGQTAEHGGQYIDSRHRHIRSLAKELRIPLVDTFEQSFPAGSLDPMWLDGALRDPDVVFADFGLFIDRLRADYRRVGRYAYDKAGPEANRVRPDGDDEWFEANLPGGAGSLLGRLLGTFWSPTTCRRSTSSCES